MYKYSILKKNTGFTLVEILIVTVVIAVLSAISVPIFIDYMQDDYDEEVADETQLLLNASQTVFYDLYADNIDNGNYTCIIPGAESSDASNYRFYGTNNKKYDCDIHLNTAITQRVYELSKVDLNNTTYGNIFWVCLGRADIYADPCSEYYDPVKAYTVYMVIFQPKENEKVTFYIAGAKEPVYKSPLKVHPEQKNAKVIVNGVEKKADYLIIDNEKIYIQYYSLKNGLKNNMKFENNIWNIIYKDYN